MKKRYFAGLIGMAALMFLLPQGVEAANDVRITAPLAGDKALTVSYSAGAADDRYQIKINNSKVAEGTLAKEGNASQTFALDNALKEGDSVLLYVTGPEGNYVPYTATVAKRPEPVAPKTMTASSKTVLPSNNAAVDITFDSAYVAAESDALQITAFDAAGSQLDSWFQALPDTAGDPVSVALRDAREGNYYIIDFLSGLGTASVPSVRVDVKTQATPSPVDPNKPTHPNKPADNTDGELAKAVDIDFSYPSASVSLGESASPTLTLVYADGSRHAYKGAVRYSYGGSAVVEGSFDAEGRFSVTSNADFVGSKIQVTAMVGSFSKTVELTVVANDKSFILTPETGAVGSANRVTFQLGDGNKNFLRLLWQPTVAQVVARPTTDSTATIVGTVTDMSGITTSGKGTMLLTSDKPTEADVYVVFRDGENRMFETAHMTYTFSGSAVPPSNDKHTVELFIDSSKYTIDGKSGVSDTETVIKQNRTFIPFRLAAEALGAEVKWNADDMSITATYNGHTIVMRIGSDSYTVDGVSKKMDVQPYIDTNNRTMVPIRFMGEGLGCTVDAVAGSNGLTQSVTIRS